MPNSVSSSASPLDAFSGSGEMTEPNLPSRATSGTPLWSRTPLAIAVPFFLLLTAALYLISLHFCQGVWTYAFDDAYIHLAISHNLAYSGVWGVAANRFSSASSSPLWTVVLAAVLRVWNSEYVPLSLNVLSGVGVLCVAAQAWSGPWATERFSGGWRTVGLLVLCLAVPLPVVAIVGMEHNLQLLLALCFLVSASRVLGERRSARPLTLWAFLMGGIRPESIFLATWTVLALARQKRFVAAGAVLASALAPFVLHGVMAISQGWSFWPASIALKRHVIEKTLPGILLFGEELAWRTVDAWALTAMVIVALLLRRCLASPALRAALLLFTLATLCHVAVSVYNHFYRYEAYLFGLGVALLWPAFVEVLPRERRRTVPGIRLVALVVVCGWGLRAAQALWLTPAATLDIYSQQRQIARFIGQFYPQEAVILNDVGTTDWAAVNRYGGRAAFDLFGLSQYEIAQIRLHQPRLQLPAEPVHRVIEEQHLRVGIIYDSWFVPNIFPPDWVRVAQWQTSPALSSAFDRVSFWTQKSNAATLKSQLQTFQKELPPGDKTIWVKGSA